MYLAQQIKFSVTIQAQLGKDLYILAQMNKRIGHNKVIDKKSK